MFETIPRQKRRYFLLLAALLAMLTPLCLSVDSNRPATAAKARKTAAKTKQEAKAAALRAATKGATGASRASLEMKENVDFLLTPALLMQEALSDDTVITYPSE